MARFGFGPPLIPREPLREDDIGNDARTPRRANLSPTAQRYLNGIGLGVEDLFQHILAILHDADYRKANAGALRMEWARIPLPGWPDRVAAGTRDTLSESVARGRERAALLEPETPVAGVTQGPLHSEMSAIAVPATIDGRNMAADDFAVTAGWGHYGQGDAVMPGQGLAVEQSYTKEERAPLGDATAAFVPTTFDVYLNGCAFWRGVPPPSGGTNSAAIKS